jgi:hypothetical protein
MTISFSCSNSSNTLWLCKSFFSFIDILTCESCLINGVFIVSVKDFSFYGLFFIRDGDFFGEAAFLGDFLGDWRTGTSSSSSEMALSCDPGTVFLISGDPWGLIGLTSTSSSSYSYSSAFGN